MRRCRTFRPPRTAIAACRGRVATGAVGRWPRSAAPAVIAPTIVRPMIPLGQFRDTFIIAVDDEGIAIIDQHVAHERVLFERITERLTAATLESQRLLVPLLLELAPAQRPGAGGARAELERLGFEVEEFGGDSDAGVGGAGAARPAMRRDRVARAGRGSRGARPRRRVQEALKRIAATMACHAAVKANDPLTLEKMALHPRRAAADRLLDDLPARPTGDAAPDPARESRRIFSGSDPATCDASV